ncbi:MAG: EipB family protein, partial [Aestuariivirgaceae bacterium]
MIRPVQFACATLLALIVMAGQPVKADVTIAAHRAVYDLSLKRATDRSGVSSVSGRMVIELTGNRCEGWAVTFRMVNQYLLQRGMTRLSDNRSSSWESGDGLHLHYTQRQFVDSKLQTEGRVKVDRSNPTGPGKGEMTKPNEEAFEIAPGVVFPVQHQIRLVEAALAGESRERSVVYDGSEGAKAYVAVSFI